MSILQADNFSIYGANPGFMLEGVYAQVDCTLDLDPDGISPGRVFNTRGDNQNNTIAMRYVFQNGVVNTIGVAMRVWLTNLPGNNNRGKTMRLKTIGNDSIAELFFTSTGALAIGLEGGATYVTPIPVVTAKGWYHIEFKFHVAGAGLCDFEVRIEGATVLEAEGVAVVPFQPAQLDFISRNTNDDSYRFLVKDFVIWDGLGAANNDFLGSVLVATLIPQADVSLNWLPVGGATGAGILDNVPPNNATYIFAEDVPLPAPFVCTLSDLPDEVTSVKALVSYVRAAKSDGGDGGLQVGIIASPADAPATVLGANRPITVAQTYWRDVFEVNPKTGAAWLPTAVNDVNLRINRTL
jgi:hypothetical protein